jgi:hypothetical protein
VFGNAAHFIYATRCMLFRREPYNHTANSLGLLKAWPLSMAAKNAEALITPIPGMLRSILPLSLSSTNSSNCFFYAF